jgi:HEAT repeat protein/beta-lactamase regulating signal transducer with metallopeptidase domain
MRELPLIWAAGVLVKGTLLLLFVLLVSVALRRASAGLRHLVWSAGIAALLLLPIVSLTLPWKLPVPAAPLVEPSPARKSPPPGASQAQRSAVPAAFKVPSPVPEAASPVTRRPGVSMSAMLSGLLALWIAGAVVLLGRLALGAAVVRRIVSRGEPLDSPDWTRPLLEGADRLSLDAVPRLVASDRLPMPFACGLLQPVIVLPQSATAWSDRRRRAVLCHELAHVRRLDLPVNALGQLACAIYWFHPLVWVAARRLRMESERACDDLVLGVGTRASEYADHLLQIVCGAARARTPAVALPMAERREFEGRMLAILERNARRDAPGRRQAATLAAFALALLLPLAALGPATAPAREALPGQRDEVIGPQAKAEARSSTRSRESQQASVQAAEQRDRQRVAGQPETQEPQGKPQGSAKEREKEREKEKTHWKRGAAQGGTDPEVVSALVAALGDSVESVREDAAYALGQLEAKDAVAPLGARLARDPDAKVRKMTAWALGQIQAQEATEPLSRAAQADASPEVREMAVWALGQLEDPAAVPALEAVLRDASPELRGQAAWAIGTIEPSTAPQGLIAALKDASSDVRLRAAWALGQIEDGAAVPGLMPLLKDSVPEVRKAAFWALGAIGGDAAQPALIEALKDRDPDVRAAAARALAGQHQDPWPWPSPRPIIR